MLGLPLQIRSAPPAVTMTSNVSVEFDADKTGTNFSCQLTNIGEITLAA